MHYSVHTKAAKNGCESHYTCAHNYCNTLYTHIVQYSYLGIIIILSLLSLYWDSSQSCHSNWWKCGGKEEAAEQSTIHNAKKRRKCIKHTLGAGGFFVYLIIFLKIFVCCIFFV